MKRFPELDDKAQRGSKPRCHLFTDGSRAEVAGRLTGLVTPFGSVSRTYYWTPAGFDNIDELQLHKPNALISDEKSRDLENWWFTKRGGASPTWDLSSQCVVGSGKRAKRGVLLVEAKAPRAELDSESGGKRLKLGASSTSRQNHERIGQAIEEANERRSARVPSPPPWVPAVPASRGNNSFHPVAPYGLLLRVTQKRHWSVRFLSRVLATPTILGAFAFLPVVFPEGTDFHDTAMSLRTYGSLGVLQAVALGWWARTVVHWFDSHGLDFDYDRAFLVAILAAVPWVSVPTYFAMRIFEHAGEWDVIFTELSLSTLGVAVLLATGVAGMSAFSAMALTHLNRGESFLRSDTKAPPRWAGIAIIVAFLAFPLIAILILRLFP